MRILTRGLLVTGGLLAVMVAVAQPDYSKDENTLAAAMAEGKVTARFTGTGSSTGDAVRVMVQKTAKAGAGTLVLTIPPGTALRSHNPSEQNMVIAGVRGRVVDAQRYSPQSQIILTDTKPVTYILEAYCAEFTKGNPSPSTAFRLKTPDPVLSCILREGKKRNLSGKSLQAAIWIATDNVTREEMNARIPISRPDWEAGKAVAELCKGIKTISPSGNASPLSLVSEPMQFKCSLARELTGFHGRSLKDPPPKPGKGKKFLVIEFDLIWPEIKPTESVEADVDREISKEFGIQVQIGRQRWVANPLQVIVDSKILPVVAGRTSPTSGIYSSSDGSTVCWLITENTRASVVYEINESDKAAIFKYKTKGREESHTVDISNLPMSLPPKTSANPPVLVAAQPINDQNPQQAYGEPLRVSQQDLPAEARKRLPPEVGQQIEDALTNAVRRQLGQTIKKEPSAFRTLTEFPAGTDSEGKIILTFPEGGRVKLLEDAYFGTIYISKNSVLHKTKTGWVIEGPARDRLKEGQGTAFYNAAELQRAEALITKAHELWNQKSYSGAVEAAKEALTIKQKILGPEHADIKAIQEMIQKAESMVGSEKSKTNENQRIIAERIVRDIEKSLRDIEKSLQSLAGNVSSIGEQHGKFNGKDYVAKDIRVKNGKVISCTIVSPIHYDYRR